jgi:hypothetical protein
MGYAACFDFIAFLADQPVYSLGDNAKHSIAQFSGPLPLLLLFVT